MSIKEADCSVFGEDFITTSILNDNKSEIGKGPKKPSHIILLLLGYLTLPSSSLAAPKIVIRHPSPLVSSLPSGLFCKKWDLFMRGKKLPKMRATDVGRYKFTEMEKAY